MLAIIGKSGSGKIHYGPGALRASETGQRRGDSGRRIGLRLPSGRRNLQNKLSVVFQDYTTSANPRFRVKDIIGEGLTVRERRRGPAGAKEGNGRPSGTGGTPC